ncbi:MAG TPA: hypothetical protein VKA87_00860 [Nitrososphaeraceae archaeon]|nr:hypothetical protein [Nitrososphaeraceae archaeon]
MVPSCIKLCVISNETSSSLFVMPPIMVCDVGYSIIAIYDNVDDTK